MRLRLKCVMTRTQGKSNHEDVTAEPHSADADYVLWKENKIRKALKQAEDRSVMVPAEKVWEDFGFER